jgi:hypothetical protein
VLYFAPVPHVHVGLGQQPCTEFSSPPHDRVGGFACVVRKTVDERGQGSRGTERKRIKTRVHQRRFCLLWGLSVVVQQVFQGHAGQQFRGKGGQTAFFRVVQKKGFDALLHHRFGVRTKGRDQLFGIAPLVFGARVEKHGTTVRRSGPGFDGQTQVVDDGGKDGGRGGVEIGAGMFRVLDPIAMPGVGAEGVGIVCLDLGTADGGFTVKHGNFGRGMQLTQLVGGKSAGRAGTDDGDVERFERGRWWWVWGGWWVCCFGGVGGGRFVERGCGGGLFLGVRFAFLFFGGHVDFLLCWCNVDR